MAKSRLHRAIDRVPGAFESSFAALDGRLGGVPGVVRSTLHAFGQHGGGMAAAAIAYYALLTMFPLLLLLILLASALLKDPSAQDRVFALLSQQSPVPLDTIRRILDESLRYQSSLGAAAVLTLVWSVSGVFTALEKAIQRAWEITKPRPFGRGQLLGLSIVVLVALGLVLSLASASIVGLVREQVEALIPFDFVQRLFTELAPLVLLFPAFWALYSFVPYQRVKARDALAGAVFTTAAWWVVKTLFALYLGANPGRYTALYGSLGALIALLVWIYTCAQALLLGAELSAQLARRREPK